MKPMKVVRRKRTGDNKKPIIIATLSIIIALIVIASGTFLAFSLFSTQGYSKTRETTVKQDIELKDGETINASAKEGEICLLKLPKDVKAEGISFSSSNDKIASIDDGGRVDALTEGQVMLNIKGKSFESRCQFTINKAEKSDIITSAYTANSDWVKKNKGKDKNLYMVQVNRKTNVVTVFTYNDLGKYVVPVRAMVCSCGTGGKDITPIGNFNIYSKRRWADLYGNVYGQYVSDFNGDILFHSVPYKKQTHSSLKAEEYNKLGTNASQGCVRMAVSDTKWIYDNCDLGTEVNVIEDSKEKDVLGKPTSLKLASDEKWDPTDPNINNPFNERNPIIEGAKDQEIKKGNKIDLLKDIIAKDTAGKDAISKVQVIGNVVFDKAGSYKVTYMLVDDLGKTAKETITIIVK